MECCSRGRRGRCHSRANVPHGYPPPHCGKSWSLIGSLYSFFVLASLIALIYMMLEYHCDTCSARSNISSVTKNIEDITQNLAIMKGNYHELEMKISKFAQELPKIEGQIEVLEALANTIDRCQLGWDHNEHLCLPNMDAILNKCSGDNEVKKNATQHLHRRPCRKSLKLKRHSSLVT